MGRQLMTQEEWQEHQRIMQQMTAEEQARYRQEMHKKLQERAANMGLSMPESPPQPGRGYESGRGGPGGMGAGSRGRMGGGRRQ